MIVALFSDKGSPGVTTLALAVATAWPRPVLLAELDPAGGDLALRLADANGTPALTGPTGLLSLAAACRSASAARVGDHAQPLPCAPAHASMLTGVASGEQASGMSSLWPSVATALADHSEDVLADLGRLQPGSPAFAVAQRADVLVGVGRADAEGMVRLRDRMAHLLAGLSDEPRSVRAFVVLVGEDRRAAEATAAMQTVLAHAALPVEVAGCLALDPVAVTELHRGLSTTRTNRSLLMRSARGLLPALADAVEPERSATGRSFALRRAFAGTAR